MASASKTFTPMMDYSSSMRNSGGLSGGYGFSSLEFLFGTAFGFAVGAVVGIMWWEGRNESQKDKFRREVDNTLDSIQSKLQSLKMGRRM